MMTENSGHYWSPTPIARTIAHGLAMTGYSWIILGLFLGYSWVLLEDSPMLGQECDLCIAARHMSGAAIEKLKFTLDLRFSAVACLDFGP
jgi:hypothetical protein